MAVRKKEVKMNRMDRILLMRRLHGRRKEFKLVFRKGTVRILEQWELIKEKPSSM